MSTLFVVLFECQCLPHSVYLGASDHNLYALLGYDGSLRWKAAVGGEIHTTPLFWSRYVYVAASDGAVYAFDADSGQRTWSTVLVPPQQAAGMAPSAVLSSPVLAVNGRVWVACGTGDVFELDGVSGASTLKASLGAEGQQWLAPTRDYSKVFVTSSGGNGAIYAVSRSAGGILWKAAVGLPTGPAAEAPNHGVGVATQSGLVALDAANGKVVASAHVAGAVDGVAIDQASGAVFVSTSSGEVKDLFLQVPPGNSYSVYWDMVLSKAAAYSPLLVPNIGLYVTGADGTVASMGINVSGTIWSTKPDVDFAGSPAYGLLDARDTAGLIVVSSSGRIYALDPANGNVRWQQKGLVVGRVDAPALVQ